MQVREKACRIDVHISGSGSRKVAELIREKYPDAEIHRDGAVPWRSTSLARGLARTRTSGGVLRAYRDRAGLNLGSLSLKTGISPRKLSRLEQDKDALTPEQARILGRALGVSPDRLL